MKKLSAIILAFICVLGMAGCSQQLQQTKGKQLLLEEGNVVKIEVSSFPGKESYSFSGEKAKAIIDYLADLNLESDFEEKADKYMGRTWVISLEYDTGDKLNLYHLGNKFIRSEKGSWYKMTYDEASRFDTLLYELKS